MNEMSQEKQESKNKKKSERTVEESLASLWEKNVKYIGPVIATAAALTAILAIPLTMYFENPFRIRRLAVPKTQKQVIRDMHYFGDKLSQQERIINDVKNQLNALTKLDTTIDVGAQTALIRSDVETLNLRVQTLEEGLLENPEKALAIPLMRKDIQKIELSYKETIAAMTKNIDRVYDQNKWFIGLMFTMAIGLISLAVSNFAQMRKKQ